MDREYRLLLNGERAAQKGQDAPSTEEPMFLRLGIEINRVVHSSMTTPDIEAEIVRRTLNTCCTLPQRKARTLRLPQRFWHLLSRSNVSSKDGAEPADSVRKNSCLAIINRRPLPSKEQLRAHKRRKLEDLAGELERAVSCNQVKSTYAMVQRLAPLQAPPRVTVRENDGSPTCGHDGEITARRDALVTIFGAEPLSLNAEPQTPKAKKWRPPETLVTHKS